MIRAVRRIQFCAGHRLLHHEGKCAHMHGHNYVAFFHAQADQLDDLGRVIDFSVLKEKIGGWIEKHWDHGFIYDVRDIKVGDALDLFTDQKRYSLDENPTAENLASYLLNRICPMLLGGSGVTVTKVVLWETENCFAEVTL